MWPRETPFSLCRQVMVFAPDAVPYSSLGIIGSCLHTLAYSYRGLLTTMYVMCMCTLHFALKHSLLQPLRRFSYSRAGGHLPLEALQVREL